ncbi:unnamed protein product, partial [Mesorhabditis spiculigera]
MITVKKFRSERAAKGIWKSLGPGDAVCFDIDETLRKDNILLEFANWLGVGDFVQKVTNMPFSPTFTHADSMRLRLSIMNFTREQYNEFLQLHISTIREKSSPGARDLITTLRNKGIDVYLVGGGFRENADNMGNFLGIPRDHTYSHDLVFDADGRYKDLDVSGISDGQGNHGKSNLLRVLKAERQIDNLVMIGDSTIDMVACPPANLCIGFGRWNLDPRARAVADWYLMDMGELLRAL